MRILKNTVITLFIIATAIGSYFMSSTYESLIASEARVVAEQQKVKSLQGEVFEKNNQLVKQESELKISKDNVTALSKANDEQKAHIDTLAGKAKELTTEVKTLKQEADQHKANVKALESENSQLKKKLTPYKDSGESPSVSSASVSTPKVSTQSASVQPQKKAESKTTVPSRGRSTSNRTFAVTATQYTADCHGCSGITATGLDVRNTTTLGGKVIIAVDPNVIKLGSLVRVTTSGGSFVAQAEDTGGAIKGNKIDILTSSTQKALAFGRQTVTVEILRNGR